MGSPLKFKRPIIDKNTCDPYSSEFKIAELKGANVIDFFRG
jgi:hypothetical protein